MNALNTSILPHTRVWKVQINHFADSLYPSREPTTYVVERIGITMTVIGAKGNIIYM